MFHLPKNHHFLIVVDQISITDIITLINPRLEYVIGPYFNCIFLNTSILVYHELTKILLFNVRQHLNETYANKWIGRGGPVY